jgi:hypothetical protein
LEKLKYSDRGQAKAVYDRVMSSPSPYLALVDWHKRQVAAAEIGDDPAAYREKLKAEILAELQSDVSSRAPAQQQPAAARTPAAMPSNFATGRNVGARSGPSWSGPQPLKEIFDFRDKGKL